MQRSVHREFTVSERLKLSRNSIPGDGTDDTVGGDLLAQLKSLHHSQSVFPENSIDFQVSAKAKSVQRML